MPVAVDPMARARARRTAEALLRMALPLLAIAGEGLEAARLQHAIDSIEGDG